MGFTQWGFGEQGRCVVVVVVVVEVVVTISDNNCSSHGSSACGTQSSGKPKHIGIFR